MTPRKLNVQARQIHRDRKQAGGQGLEGEGNREWLSGIPYGADEDALELERGYDCTTL